MLMTIAVLLWVVCGVLAFGASRHDLFHTYKRVLDTLPNRRRDRSMAALMGIGGPIGLIAVLVCATSRGLTFRLPPEDQREESFRYLRDFTTGRDLPSDVHREWWIRTNKPELYRHFYPNETRH